MTDKDHCPKFERVDQEPFPSQVIMILEPIGIEEDLQEGDRNSSIKIDLGIRQEVDLFLQ